MRGRENRSRQRGMLEEADDIYDEQFAEELLEDDELSSGEEAFMRGYHRIYGKEREDYY